MDEENAPLKNVRYGPPKVSLRNTNLESALRTSLVPCVVDYCSVVAVRAIFEFASHEESVKQIAARRKRIEDELLKSDSVSCI